MFIDRRRNVWITNIHSWEWFTHAWLQGLAVTGSLRWFLCSVWAGRISDACQEAQGELGLPKASHPQCVVFDVQMRQAFLLPGAEVIRAEPAQSRESCAVLCWIDLSNEKLSQSVLPDMDVELDTTGKDSDLERLSTSGIYTGSFFPQNYSMLLSLVTYWKTRSHAQCLGTPNEFTNPLWELLQYVISSLTLEL